MGFGGKKKKTKKKKVAKKPCQKDGKVLKKPAAKPPCQKVALPTGRAPWVKLRVCNANKPVPRSYITGTTTKDSKKLNLIVEVSSKRTKKHKQIIAHIKKELEEKDLTKAEAIQLREDMC